MKTPSWIVVGAVAVVGLGATAAIANVAAAPDARTEGSRHAVVKTVDDPTPTVTPDPAVTPTPTPAATPAPTKDCARMTDPTNPDPDPRGADRRDASGRAPTWWHPGAQDVAPPAPTPARTVSAIDRTSGEATDSRSSYGRHSGR